MAQIRTDTGEHFDMSDNDLDFIWSALASWSMIVMEQSYELASDQKYVEATRAQNDSARAMFISIQIEKIRRGKNVGY